MQTCRQALPPHGRLLLIELLLPTAGGPGLEAVMADVTMLTRVGVRERTEVKNRVLLGRGGLHLERIIGTRAAHNILECVAG